jgi:hypothetical protein
MKIAKNWGENSFATEGVFTRTIPKGLRPKAQGWRSGAYLGYTPRESSTATRLWPLRISNEIATTVFAVENVCETVTQGSSLRGNPEL